MYLIDEENKIVDGNEFQTTPEPRFWGGENSVLTIIDLSIFLHTH